MEERLQMKEIFTQTIEADWLQQRNITLNVLRLDKIHSVISGNKWFKLKYYLLDAIKKGFTGIGTFGGPFSNHIIATACLCHSRQLKSIGIIRGMQPAQLPHTLAAAQQYGMKLYFVSRTAYKEKDIVRKKFNSFYWVNEGGYGIKGATGAREILAYCSSPEKYSHIVCAVGTGTMMAGIITKAKANQRILGISIMKDNHSLIEQVRDLLATRDENKSYKILHNYHFGGYAKHPQQLIEYMNKLWQQHGLPTDIVYTSKVFFAIEQMVTENTIPAGSNVLMIHSGGLQGNFSLPAGTLYF